MNLNTNKNNKVFISYAQEDSNAAERLYRDLKHVGLEPWLDKDVLPGQNRRSSINNALQSSRYFIPLLSSNSVEGRGYVQRDLRAALDILQEFPSNDIFIIPIRLDDCKISDDRINELQMADLFPDWDVGIKKVVRAMNIQSDDLKKEAGLADISKDNKLAINLSDVYWADLITLIDQKKCIPFIGPAASSPWISLRMLADKWMKEHDYPFADPDVVKTPIGEEDSYKLARVTQFLAIKEANEMFPKLLLRQEVSNTLAKIESPDFSLPPYHPYSVLAGLDLPIYLTTNYDHLMEAALNSRRKEPVSEFCRWNETLDPISDKSRKYQPTVSKPLVYHLHGDINTPESMVLTERDYFDFVIKLNKEDDRDLFPTAIRRELPESSLLFIGYSLQDINFRAIFQGALSSFQSARKRSRKTSVAVQIPPSISNNKVVKYLDDYAKNMFEVHAYWGDIGDFAKELRQKFENFKKTNATLTVSSS